MQELMDRLEVLISAEQIVNPDSIRLRGMLDVLQIMRDRMTTIIIRSEPRVRGNDAEFRRLWTKA